MICDDIYGTIGYEENEEIIQYEKIDEKIGYEEILCEPKCKKNQEKIQYGKIYYFDRSGIPINESEIKSLNDNCIPIIKSCCRLQLPRGFKFSEDFPSICFNLSNLSCNKTPILQRIKQPTANHELSMECEVVTGYEVRAVGDIDFSISTPINPVSGYCFPAHSHTCCTTTIPVNKIISYTCCPKACSSAHPCIDWNFVFFVLKINEDTCGSYLEVNMGVALEYIDTCEPDEE